MARLRIVLEFSAKREDDIRLYEALQKYSSPSAYIKDALKGLVPLPGDQTQVKTQVSRTVKSEIVIREDEEKDEEDLMNF